MIRFNTLIQLIAIYSKYFSCINNGGNKIWHFQVYPIVKYCYKSNDFFLIIITSARENEYALANYFLSSKRQYFWLNIVNKWNRSFRRPFKPINLQILSTSCDHLLLLLNCHTSFPQIASIHGFFGCLLFLVLSCILCMCLSHRRGCAFIKSVNLVLVL